MGIYTGLTRYFNEYEDKNNLKNTALTFSIIWGTVFCVFTFLISKFAANIIFNGDPLGSQYINYTVASSVFLCLISIYNMYYSMQYKALLSSLINIVKMLLTLGLTVVLMLNFNQGIIGALQAQLITYALIVLFLMLKDIKNFRFRLKRKELGDMLSYGAALAPGQMSSWVLTLIDRYFIKGMINLSAVGIYSVGYKVGTMIDPVFIVPFRSAFAPYKFDVYKQEDGKEKIREVYKYFNFLGWFVILGLSLFGNTAIKILTTSEYAEAFKVVPLIAFSYFLWGLVEFYGFGLHVANKAIISSMIVTISAVLNIVFNFILIPSYGINGAALATILSYIFTNILYYFFGKKYYSLGLNLMEPFKYLLVFGVVYACYYFIKPHINNIFIEILLAAALCVMYLILNIVFKFISIETVKNIVKFISRKKR
jgi:O-antigen/teichoic acid export membrane protein